MECKQRKEYLNQIEKVPKKKIKKKLNKAMFILKKKEEELGQKSELEKIDAQPTGKTISGIEGDLRWETFGHFDVSLEIFFPKVVRLKCGEFRQQLLRA